MINRKALDTAVVFCHHPCPDGTAGLLMLKQKLGTAKNVTYSGLNHTAPIVMQEKIDQVLATQPTDAHIYFVDIAPTIGIIKKLLETHNGKITILDHHATAINEINHAKEQLAPYLESQKLELILDVTRSGAGIAHDYVFMNQKYPQSIALAQTIDLLTATGDASIIRQFAIDKKALHPRHRTLLARLATLANNEQIESSIAFYVIAAAFDIEMNRIFANHANQVDSAFISEAEDFFDSIDIYGNSILLDYKNLEKAFSDQLLYQQDALDKAKTFTSPLHPETDLLYVPADIKCGRTFDPLISAKIKSLPKPTLALIANVNEEKSIKESNWVALRAADDKVNLFDIASEFKLKGMAVNAGGHARASALQCNPEQMQNILHQVQPYYKSEQPRLMTVP